ncbi:hypothetical protein N9Y92_02410 [Chlamydiales bacterium]|nr:hypothetical protein [Chlamydiales bacterium]
MGFKETGTRIYVLNSVESTTILNIFRAFFNRESFNVKSEREGHALLNEYATFLSEEPLVKGDFDEITKDSFKKMLGFENPFQPISGKNPDVFADVHTVLLDT